MFIDWLPEVLRPWRSGKSRLKRNAQGGRDGAQPVAASVEALEPLQMLSAATITLDQPQYDLGDSIRVRLIDPDLAGAGTQNVVLAAAGGEQETLELTETSVLGIFEGTIQSRNAEDGSGLSENGVLDGRRNTLVTASYFDANGAVGQAELKTVSSTFYLYENLIDFDFSNLDGSAAAEGFTSSGSLNLWHLSTGRGQDAGHSGDDSFYFGSGEGAAGGGGYSPNSNGTLTSPLIDLSNLSGQIYLELNQFLDLEDVNDTASISVVSPLGTFLLASNNGVNANLPDSTGGFQPLRLDLSAYAGTKIRLAFQLQSNDSVQGEGWYVDDVRIRTPLSTIEGTKWHDLNGNGMQEVNEPALPGWTVFLDHNNNGVLDSVVTTVSAAGMPLAIPDEGQVVSTLDVANVPSSLSDVNVTLSINHSRVSDLDVYLISPAGTRIELFTDVGALGQNFTNTTLDDQATFSISLGSAPFVGAFSPEGLLSALNGENANGTWSLQVIDDAASETGSIIGWSLTMVSPEQSAVTDAEGRYTLKTFQGGTFTVREVPQLGWQQTLPSGATVNNPNPSQIVTVDYGGQAAGVDFYNQYVFPVLTLPGGTVTYTENGPPVLIEPGALLDDANSPNFGGGSLSVALTENATVNDRLTIRSYGFGPLQVGIVGNQVLYEGTAIGTFSGGVGTVPLLVNFNLNATTAAVRAVVRAIQFETLGDNPSGLTRTARFIIVDEANGASTPVSKLIDVIPVNDAPVLNITPGTLNYIENGPPLPLDLYASLSDPDSPNFDGGYLQVSLLGNEAGPSETSTFNVGSGNVNLALDNNTVNSSITVSGVNGRLSDVNVTLNINHTNTPEVTVYLVGPTGVRVKLLSNVGTGVFVSQNFTNTTLDDEAAFPILSGSAVSPYSGSFRPENELFVYDGQSPNGQWTLEVTDAVGNVLDGTGSLVSWSLGLTVTETSSNENLAIINQGPGLGSIGVVGNNVTYSGVVIGSFTGGVGSTPLFIAFNANATQEAVQSLLQNITVSIEGDSPLAGPRQAVFILDDGDGGTSLPAIRQLNVIAINDAPVLTLPAGMIAYIEGSIPSLIDSFATVTDLDSTDFNGGVLTVSLGATAKPGDRLGVRSTSQLPGEVSVVGSNIRYGTTVVATMSGGDVGVPLTITFNGSSTPAAVQAVVRALTFESTATNPDNAPRLISVQITDGDGGFSALISKVAAVYQVNDPPVITLSTDPSFVNYNANGLPVLLDAQATVTDPDTSSFSGGQLVVTLTSGGSNRDRLGLQSQGQLTVVGTSLFFGGVLIGRLTPGASLQPLVVNFNSSASLEAVQAVVQAVNFQIQGSNPVGGDRIASYTLSDGGGGISLAQTRRITVQINNQPPVNTVPEIEIQVAEDEPIAITGLSVSDPDAFLLPIQVILQVTNGSLTIDTTVEGGLSAEDVVGNGTKRVSITADQERINATLAALNGVVYQGSLDFNGVDTLTMTTTDLGNSGPGGVLTDTDSVFINVQAVFDTARITNSGSLGINYRGNEALLDSTARIEFSEADPDLDGAYLSIAVVDGFNRSDRLRLMSEGRAEGQINVATSKSGTASLRNGSLRIGTVSGGENGKPLKITFNANATVDDVQRVIKLVTFRTAVQTTVYGIRSVAYTYTDSLGLTSDPSYKEVEVVRS